MRITCDAYIEPSSQGARLGRAQNFRPAVCKGTSIAVDRDEVRRVLAQRATLVACNETAVVQCIACAFLLQLRSG